MKLVGVEHAHGDRQRESRLHSLEVLPSVQDDLSKASLRVMLVDSNEVVRAGVTSVLRDETDIEVVASVGLAHEAQRDMMLARPNVVLISDRPGEGGPELCASILSKQPSTAVIVLSARPNAECVGAYLDAGARAFLAKGSMARDFAPAIRAVARRVSILAPDAAEEIIALARRTLRAERLAHSLTSDEIEVIAALADGLSNKGISARLTVPERVVKARLVSAMRKLGAERRAGLVGAAIRAGIIPGETDVTKTPRRIAASARTPIPAKELNVRPCRVLVVDDREVVRAGLSALLRESPDIDVVGSEGSPGMALAAVERADPDVLLADVRRSNRIAELGRHLAERRARPVLIGVCARFDEQPIRRALEAGARACIVGDIDAELLQKTIATVFENGSKGKDPDLVDWATLAERRYAGKLSLTEQRVLELLIRGLTNGEIAKVTSTSPHNVKRLVKQIYAKLCVRTRAEAVAVGLRQALLRP